MNNQDYQSLLYKELEIIDSKLKKIRAYIWFCLAISAIALLFGFMLTLTSIPLIFLYNKGYHDSIMTFTVIWFGVLLVLMYLSYQYSSIIFIIFCVISSLEAVVAFAELGKFEVYSIVLFIIRIISLVVCIYGLSISSKKKQIEDILYHE